MSTTTERKLLGDFTNLTPEQEKQLEPIGNLMAVTKRSMADLATTDKRKIVERCVNDTIKMEEMTTKLLGEWERKDDLQKVLGYLQSSRKNLIETLGDMRPEEHDPLARLMASLSAENENSGLETKVDLVLAKLTNIEHLLHQERAETPVDVDDFGARNR